MVIGIGSMNAILIDKWFQKEVTDWATWQAALDRGDSIEELLGLGTDRNCHQNSQGQLQQHLPKIVINKYLTVLEFIA